MPHAENPRNPRHILLLTDRDWTHPQGGGTGTNLYGQVSRWVAWGHRVTVIAGSYPGAEAISRPHERLTIHRMGGRTTVFGRAALASWRGIGRDADVVLEVVNGIAFFTPLWWWLRAPRVTLVHHVHQDHYVAEMGRRGRLAALVAERLPLATLYRHHPFLTISDSARRDMVALGIPSEQIHVAYLGVEPDAFVRDPARRRARRCSTSAGSSSTSGSSSCSTSWKASRARGWRWPATATTARCWRRRSTAAGCATAWCCTASSASRRSATSTRAPG